MQISIITTDTDFLDLLTQHSIFNDVNFMQYENIYQYKEAEVTSDILIICNNIPGQVEGHNMSIKIGKDLLVPYRLKDLFAIIDKKLQKEKEYDVFGCKFYYLKKILKYQNKTIDITEKEADIIMALLKIAPNSLEKKNLLNMVWGYGENVDTHTLETHVYRLRKKINSSLNLSGDIILTDKNGYKINSK